MALDVNQTCQPSASVHGHAHLQHHHGRTQDTPLPILDSRLRYSFNASQPTATIAKAASARRRQAPPQDPRHEHLGREPSRLPTHLNQTQKDRTDLVAFAIIARSPIEQPSHMARFRRFCMDGQKRCSQC